jgi:hypothetical protein
MLIFTSKYEHLSSDHYVNCKQFLLSLIIYMSADQSDVGLVLTELLNSDSEKPLTNTLKYYVYLKYEN